MMHSHDDEIVDPTSQAFRALAKLLAVSRLSGFVMASYGIFQGAIILIGGDNRFSQIGYITAMRVPGAPDTWGWILGVSGIVAWFGIKNRMYCLASAGMFGGGAWSFAFGGAFLISSVQYPNANLTAMVTYGKDGVLFILMAIVLRVLAHTKTKPEEPTDA